MKTLITLFICLTTLSIQSQYSVVSITVKPDKSRQILIDGKNYASDKVSRKGESNKYTITDLKPGQHKITVNPRRGDAIITSFTLRQNYHIEMEVLRNHTITIIEHRNDNYDPFKPPISDADFTSLIRDVTAQHYTSAKRVAVARAFLNRDYLFNGEQAIELLDVIPDMPSKIQLAKLAYNAMSPVSDINLVIRHFQDTMASQEILRFITQQKRKVTVAPMQHVTFTGLVQKINAMRYLLDKDAAIFSAFMKRDNYFTTIQARELIAISGTDEARLLLAKASYKTITDKENFTSINDLFRLQQSRNTLASFISVSGIDGSSRDNNWIIPEMSDEDFASIKASIASNSGGTFGALETIFSHSYYTFSVKQVAVLVELLSSEDHKLVILKSSFRTITDRENFENLLVLLRNDEKKKILVDYVGKYIGE